MTDDDVRANVIAELLWEAKVDSTEIEVSADHGAITLTGSVASLPQKRQAQDATRRVYGVTSVSNQLTVQVLTPARRADADVRADVLQALRLDTTIPASVEATVNDGLVTLTGTVVFHHQRAEAEFICASVRGVVDINDQVTLSSAPRGDNIEHQISSAFRRSARLAIDDLSVDVRPDGTVVLAGAVTSCPEHDDALAAAWSAPGVTDIDDRIIVFC
jgi:osmotically-inducible protein OsmY